VNVHTELVRAVSYGWKSPGAITVHAFFIVQSCALHCAFIVLMLCVSKCSAMSVAIGRKELIAPLPPLQITTANFACSNPAVLYVLIVHCMLSNLTNPIPYLMDGGRTPHLSLSYRFIDRKKNLSIEQNYRIVTTRSPMSKGCKATFTVRDIQFSKMFLSFLL